MNIHPSINLLSLPILCTICIIASIYFTTSFHPPVTTYPYISGDYIYMTSQTSYHLERARTPTARQQGLMHRTHLAPQSGMLFVFDVMGIYPFWMSGTYIPLDILWLDDNLHIVDSASMIPCQTTQCPIYTPIAPARYALEITAGQKNLAIGH